MRQLCHLGDGHNRTDFVIDHHDGNEDRVLPQRVFQGIYGDSAQSVGLQIGNLKPLGFQLMHTI